MTGSPLRHSLLAAHSTRSARLATAVVCLALATIASLANAQSSSPLRIDVGHASNVSRTSGPVRLQLNLDWGGPGVFHGSLHLVARDSDRTLLGMFEVDNLYLTEGVQSQEVMLPGFRVGTSTFDNAITLTPRLVEAKTEKQWQLDDLQIIAPSNERRELVVAVVSPEPDITDASDEVQSRRRENEIIDAIRLEGLAPLELTDSSRAGWEALRSRAFGGGRGRPRPAGRQRDKPQMLTKMIDWWADDAPQEPLRYCACDIVLLPSSGLKLLDQPQLDALLAWVRAGGAACVLVEGDGHDATQVAWLNTIAGADDDNPLFLRDSRGRLIHELDEASEAPLKNLIGLGRAVVVLGAEQAEPHASHWKLTTAFLWRMKGTHLSRVETDGVWDFRYSLNTAEKYLQQNAYGYAGIDEAKIGQAGNFLPLPPLSLTDLILRLLPDGVRLVPLSTMGLLLLGYLIAIGPLDYFVLGRLKMRRWTWCTFPIVTLLFTGASIWLSNRSMSANEMRRSAVIRDVAADGALVRENRLELLFPSSSQVVTTDVGRGLCMPARYQDFAQLGSMTFDSSTGQYTTIGKTEPAMYAGRMPTQSKLVQTVPQWTPQLNRILTIPLQQPDNMPDFDWTEVPDFETEAGRQRLNDRIRQSFGVELSDQIRNGFSETVTAGVFHLDESRPLLGDSDLIRLPRGERRLVSTRYGQQWMHQTESYLQQISVATQPGFLGVVSQYAPTGGDRTEDLTLLDPTDPRQWLLVIVQPSGADFHIYRRLYVLED